MRISDWSSDVCSSDLKKVSSERKFFPGYVLVKMEMTNESYHLVKEVPKVTGFLGTANKPTPISEREAEQILQQVKEGVERPRSSVIFEVGEEVRVKIGRASCRERVGPYV